MTLSLPHAGTVFVLLMAGAIGYFAAWTRMKDGVIDDPMTKHLLFCEDCELFCVEACQDGCECEEHE